MTKSIFVLKSITEIKTEDEARNWAIDWQNWMGEQDLSYSELSYFADYFQDLAGRFNLTDEFEENGII